MKRTIEFDCYTMRERNQRGHWSKAAARTKAARMKTADELRRAFPRFRQYGDPEIEPNTHVQITRIAPGKLDSDGADDALKAVRDGVADWLEIDDGSDLVTWHRGRSLKGPPHVYRVRIEVESDAPGEAETVVLPECESAGRQASARVKRAINKAKKG